MQESDYPSREAYVQARLLYLKKKLQELGESTFCNHQDLDPEMELAFLEQVYAIEAEPCITYAHQLIGRGIELPDPESIDDEELTRRLWEIIRGLAGLRVFMENTGHLTDRELYTQLWKEALNEFTWDMSHCSNGAMHLDLLGGGSEEDSHTWLAYYADEAQRQEWLAQFPGESLPECKQPVSDRDLILPKPDYGMGNEFDDG